MIAMTTKSSTRVNPALEGERRRIWNAEQIVYFGQRKYAVGEGVAGKALVSGVSEARFDGVVVLYLFL